MTGASKTGAEFRINTSTTGSQQRANLAALDGGGFVVVWEDPQITGTNIRGRVYNSAGTAPGNDFIVFDGPDYSAEPAVAALGTGFVVTFLAPESPSPRSVFRATFDSAGAVIVAGTEASEGTVSNRVPQIASSTAGGDLIVWDDIDESASPADPDGRAIFGSISGGGRFTINATTAGNQVTPSVVALRDGSGSYIVTYVSSNAAGTQHELKARIVAANGALLGGEIAIATNVDPDFGSTAGSLSPIAALAGGGFAVAYFDGFAIRLNVYGPDGVERATGIQLNTEQADGGVLPNITELTNRLIAVTWENFNDGRTVMVEVMAPDGTQIGPRLSIDGGAFGGDPSIVALANGDFVVAMTGTGGFNGGAGDPDGSAIVGQRFSSVAPSFVDGGNGNDAFNGTTQTGFFLGYGGFDTVSYAAAGGAVVVNMTAPALNTGVAAGDVFGETVEGLIGSSFNDTLTGNRLANTINGGTGSDTMLGLTGDDVYYVDHANDKVFEATSSGADKVYASVNYVLGVSVEVETLLARDAAAVTLLNLTGNEFAQRITGNAGANSIDGKGGADIMSGLGGDDKYYVDNAGDVVVETVGGGADKVYASVSHALSAGAEIETLLARDAASTAALNLTGSNIGQRITGNAGVNIIEGRGGADIMIGLGGGDFYYVDNAGDTIQEAAGGGFDTIFTSVSHTLGAAAEVERLLARDAAGTEVMVFTGNGVGQAILGNAGLNVIYGKGGADTLTGRGGADNFIFDTALGAGNIDTISDFSHADDTIRLDDAIFTGLTAGAYIAANQFHVGAAAADAFDRIIYNNATGALIFDADGSGAGAAQQFAQLTAGLAMASNDFYVI